MKYLVKFVVVTFFLLICTHTFADEKIVILDLKYILNNSKAGNGAQDFLKKTFKDNQKNFSAQEAQLKKEESAPLEQKEVTEHKFYNIGARTLLGNTSGKASTSNSSLSIIWENYG